MQTFKPLVTIELEEYLKTQKYIEVLEQGPAKDIYKETLEKIVSSLYYKVDRELSNKISDVLTEAGLILYIGDISNPHSLKIRTKI